MVSDKLQKLHAMLEKQPNDPFLLYGIALEHKNRNETNQAIEYLNKTVATDPNYCYAYFQLGQVYEIRGDLDAAKRSYNEGIVAARRVGDAHAQSELEGALSMME